MLRHFAAGMVWVKGKTGGCSADGQARHSGQKNKHRYMQSFPRPHLACKWLAASGVTALFIAAALANAGEIITTQSFPAAPQAKKIPKEISIHGDTRIDNYFWLREKTNADVL